MEGPGTCYVLPKEQQSTTLQGGCPGPALPAYQMGLGHRSELVLEDLSTLPPP